MNGTLTQACNPFINRKRFIVGWMGFRFLHGLLVGFDTGDDLFEFAQGCLLSGSRETGRAFKDFFERLDHVHFLPGVRYRIQHNNTLCIGERFSNEEMGVSQGWVSAMKSEHKPP